MLEVKKTKISKIETKKGYCRVCGILVKPVLTRFAETVEYAGQEIVLYSYYEPTCPNCYSRLAPRPRKERFLPVPF